VKAAILRERCMPLPIEDWPAPEVPADGLLVRGISAGVCRSDLHIIDGAYPHLPLADHPGA